MNYRRNRRYFYPLNANKILTSVLVFVIAAVIGAVFAFMVKWEPLRYTGYALFGLGLAGLVGVGAYIAVCFALKPSDAQIDAVYQSLADTAATDALEKTGLRDQLSMEMNPVVLSACNFSDIKTPFRIAKGRDRKMRSTNFSNFVLMFTLEQIITYRSTQSITRQEWEECVEEYYYDDIVTLATETSVYEMEGEIIHREVLHITTSAGTERELPFENNETAREAIAAIRKIIRAKKRFK